jgi:DNA-binding transcriptional ArsR family regulator
VARNSRAPDSLADSADLFAAFGDETRLRLLVALRDGGNASITRLTEGSRLTRQAITKHLAVLEASGVVVSERVGRESVYRLEPRRLAAAQRNLASISRQWDEALERLRKHVEK